MEPCPTAIVHLWDVYSGSEPDFAETSRTRTSEPGVVGACHDAVSVASALSSIANSFGSKKDAQEELVAEMTAAFSCAALGIVPAVRHADDIGSWLEVLREDNRAIVRAASAASKGGRLPARVCARW